MELQAAGFGSVPFGLPQSPSAQVTFFYCNLSFLHMTVPSHLEHWRKRGSTIAELYRVGPLRRTGAMAGRRNKEVICLASCQLWISQIPHSGSLCVCPRRRPTAPEEFDWSIETSICWRRDDNLRDSATPTPRPCSIVRYAPLTRPNTTVSSHLDWEESSNADNCPCTPVHCGYINGQSCSFCLQLFKYSVFHSARHIVDFIVAVARTIMAAHCTQRA